MRHIRDEERRARLAVRHALAPGAHAPTAEAATRSMTALHSTEPASVFLSLWARVPGLSVADVVRTLYDERSLVKQLAMRRTLFVFPRDLLPAAWGSASARVASIERRRLVKDVVATGLAADGDAWLDEARTAVLEALAGEPTGLTALELRENVPEIAVKIDTSGGPVWVANRVLTHLGATAHIVRGQNTQHWRLSRPRWTLMDDWLNRVPEPLSTDEGYAELTRRWLGTFGPGTETDLVWWLGATKAVVRRALADVEAVEVTLDGSSTSGWVLPDDLDPVPDPGPWVALLPVLDPTVMGWKERSFYLGSNGPALFDRNGNAGTTAWVDGRTVGCWVQDADAAVRVELTDVVSAAALEALNLEAARLTGWLDGEIVGTVYPSSAMKHARARNHRG